MASLDPWGTFLLGADRAGARHSPISSWLSTEEAEQGRGRSRWTFLPRSPGLNRLSARRRPLAGRPEMRMPGGGVYGERDGRAPNGGPGPAGGCRSIIGAGAGVG